MDETDFVAPEEETQQPAVEPTPGFREGPEVSGPVAMLRDLVYYLATNLVDDPEAVEIEVEQRGSTVNLDLRLPESEIGRVIGRQGRIAKAMRTALMVAGSRHNLRVNLNIES